jgi:Mrp family chromosome partitioning ATPase
MPELNDIVLIVIKIAEVKVFGTEKVCLTVKKNGVKVMVVALVMKKMRTKIMVERRLTYLLSIWSIQLLLLLNSAVHSVVVV